MHYSFYYLVTFILWSSICFAYKINKTDSTYKTYEWIITKSNLTESKFKSINNKKYDKKELENLFEKIIRELENTGYPFAEIEFRTDYINDYKIYGTLNLNKIKKIIIDSIAIKGYNSFPNYLIYRITDIKKKSVYNQHKINNISQKIQSLNFLKEYKRNEILFNDNKNILYVFLEKEKNNYLDAFIGFNKFNEKLVVLGKIHFIINNSINRFENVEFLWKKSENNSQEINLSIEFPYIFNSIIGLNNKIGIVQYENLFNKRELNLSISLNKKINLEYINKVSSAFDENNINSINNFKSRQVNIFWDKKYKKLEKINFTVGLGKSKIGNEDYNRKYARFYLEILTPIIKSNYISFKSINELVIGNNILENEKEIIGGQKYLRGFLDNQFLSSSYNIINIENIYYINNETYFSVFSDCGILYDNENPLVYSIGIGLGILRNNDIFSVNYAIPNQNNKFELNDAKLHFNYIIQF